MVETKTTRSLSSKLAKLPSTDEDMTTTTTTTMEPSEQTAAKRRYWLMKSEPESRIENGHEMKFGLDDLKSMPDQTTHWDGVRNFEARNHMKAMREGDLAFFYHSNCKNPGLAGVMRVCREAYVDHTQFDASDAHYDAKSDKSNPKWYMVDVKYVRDLARFVSLAEMKELHLEHKRTGGALKNLSLFTRSRLSVQALSEEEWNFLNELANKQ